jgi:hypothetical protein
LKSSRCCRYGGEPVTSLPEKARLGAEVLLAYGRVRWLLARNSLPDTLAAIRHRSPGRRGGADPDIARAARAVRATLRILPGNTRCLMQSLVLASLLARRGVDATMVIGVRSADEFSANAWLELDGKPLLPAGGSAFRRLAEL